MYDIQQSTTAFPLLFLMVLTSDHVSPATGLSPTVTLSKSGGAFASPSGAVSEIASGWYKVAGNATDSNTLGPLVLHATAATADPSDTVYNVVVYNPQDSVRLGLTALPNAAAGANGGLPTGDASGRVTIAPSQLFVKKNTNYNNFQFVMTDSTNHNPKTGLTVSGFTSKDGGGFGALTNSVSEIANGWYQVNLAAADVNGTDIALRFTATGADDLNLKITTQA
jgi:hypothetical protein